MVLPWAGSHEWSLQGVNSFRLCPYISDTPVITFLLVVLVTFQAYLHRPEPVILILARSVRHTSGLHGLQGLQREGQFFEGQPAFLLPEERIDTGWVKTINVNHKK